MRDLKESRDAIRAIDVQMASLFIQRMEVVRDVARYKYVNDLPIEDKEQEARVLSERSAQIDDKELRPYFEEFLQNTMDVSKSFQNHLINAWQINRNISEEDSQQ